MTNYEHITSRKNSRGAVLILAMVFLVLMTLVAVTVMKTSIQEFQMAGNDQFREEAFQRAQAITAEISTDLNNFPVVGGVGYTICTAADTDPDCNTSNFLQDPNSATVPTGVDVAYKVVRQGPRFLESLPFRQAEGSASSAPAFDAAIFEVSADIDGTDARLGSASVVQGIAVRVASSSQ